MASQTRGKFELFLKQEVDNHVKRLKCAPAIYREHGMPLHPVVDHRGLEREAIVLRGWEAGYLKDNLLQCMPDDNGYLHYTQSLKSVPTAWAEKELHGSSRHPYVYEPTLPQHRLNRGEIPRPLQDDYPVWYFLDGEMSCPETPAALWKLEAAPYGRPATVYSLRSESYGHCKVLAEALDDYGCQHATRSEGFAYLVKDKLAEDRLRYFKTHVFEVVRCRIELCPISIYGKSHTVDGLTFVFCYGEPEVVAPGDCPPSQDWSTCSSNEGIADSSDRAGGEEGPYAEGPASEPEGDVTTMFSKYGTIVFPFIRHGPLQTDPQQTIARRQRLLGSSRPKSPLEFMTNVSDVASSLVFTMDNPEESIRSECESNTGHRYTGERRRQEQPLGVPSIVELSSSQPSQQENVVVHIEDLGVEDEMADSTLSTTTKAIRIRSLSI